MQSIGIMEKPDVQWETCAGLQHAEDVLKEATTQLGMLCQSILLSGAAGTGKSLLVNAAVAFAQETNYILVSAYQLRNERDVKSLFSVVTESTPCIVYVDDTDALCDPDGSGRVTDDLTRAKAEFIERIGGPKPNDVLVIASTNKPWRMHSDLVQVFKKKLYIQLPDTSARALIFHRNIPTETDISEDDIRTLSEQSEGLTGADIVTVIRDAQMAPIRKLQTASHFKQVNGDKLIPCSSDTPGAIATHWSQVPEPKLVEPKMQLADLEESLKRQKPSITKDEIKEFDIFAETFGLEK